MSGKVHELRLEFLDLVPDRLEPGVLYISVRYKSVQHSCCCGCGRKVVTPLSPTGWRMTYDGRTISLWPSVGNWQKDCGSHYIIDRNRVRWARRWSEEEIAAGLERDRDIKRDYYGEGSTATTKIAADTSPSEQVRRKNKNEKKKEQGKQKKKFKFW